MDLKADRENKALLVLGVHGEPTVPAEKVADELAAERRNLAGWLELDEVVVRAAVTWHRACARHGREVRRGPARL